MTSSCTVHGHHPSAATTLQRLEEADSVYHQHRMLYVDQFVDFLRAILQTRMGATSMVGGGGEVRISHHPVAPASSLSNNHQTPTVIHVSLDGLHHSSSSSSVAATNGSSGYDDDKSETRGGGAVATELFPTSFLDHHLNGMERHRMDRHSSSRSGGEDGGEGLQLLVWIRAALRRMTLVGRMPWLKCHLMMSDVASAAAKHVDPSNDDRDGNASPIASTAAAEDSQSSSSIFPMVDLDDTLVDLHTSSQMASTTLLSSGAVHGRACELLVEPALRLLPTSAGTTTTTASGSGIDGDGCCDKEDGGGTYRGGVGYEWMLFVPYVPTVDAATLLQQCHRATEVIEVLTTTTTSCSSTTTSCRGWALRFFHEDDARWTLGAGIHGGVQYASATWNTHSILSPSRLGDTFDDDDGGEYGEISSSSPSPSSSRHRALMDLRFLRVFLSNPPLPIQGEEQRHAWIRNCVVSALDDAEHAASTWTQMKAVVHPMFQQSYRIVVVHRHAASRRLSLPPPTQLSMSLQRSDYLQRWLHRWQQLLKGTTANQLQSPQEKQQPNCNHTFAAGDAMTGCVNVFRALWMSKRRQHRHQFNDNGDGHPPTVHQQQQQEHTPITTNAKLTPYHRRGEGGHVKLDASLTLDVVTLMVVYALQRIDAAKTLIQPITCAVDREQVVMWLVRRVAAYFIDSGRPQPTSAQSHITLSPSFQWGRESMHIMQRYDKEVNCKEGCKEDRGDEGEYSTNVMTMFLHTYSEDRNANSVKQKQLVLALPWSSRDVVVLYRFFESVTTSLTVSAHAAVRRGGGGELFDGVVETLNRFANATRNGFAQCQNRSPPCSRTVDNDIGEGEGDGGREGNLMLCHRCTAQLHRQRTDLQTIGVGILNDALRLSAEQGLYLSHSALSLLAPNRRR